MWLLIEGFSVVIEQVCTPMDALWARTLPKTPPPCNGAIALTHATFWFVINGARRWGGLAQA
jgi:hypothetical protein